MENPGPQTLRTDRQREWDEGYLGGGPVAAPGASVAIDPEIIAGMRKELLLHRDEKLSREIAGEAAVAESRGGISPIS